MQYMLTFAFIHHPYLVCILFGMPSLHLFTFLFSLHRGAGAGPAGTAAVGPMLEAKLMNLIKGRLQKF